MELKLKKKLKKKLKVKSPTGYRKLPLTELDPNPWNQNTMDPDTFAKVERNVMRTLEKTGSTPPIVVRKHPQLIGRYQIIDGEHRWRIYKKHDVPDIDAFVIDVDDATARILTTNLNYLRGQPDETKYAALLHDLIKTGMTADDLAEMLPESKDGILDLIDSADASHEMMRLLRESEEKREAGEKEKDTDGTAPPSDDTWVDLKFSVSATQAKIIEAEIDRIEERLKGKNRRGRALEYMAVMSAQTPSASLDDTLDLGETGKGLPMKMSLAKRKEPKGPKKPKQAAKEVV